MYKIVKINEGGEYQGKIGVIIETNNDTLPPIRTIIVSIYPDYDILYLTDDDLEFWKEFV